MFSPKAGDCSHRRCEETCWCQGHQRLQVLSPSLRGDLLVSRTPATPSSLTVAARRPAGVKDTSDSKFSHRRCEETCWCQGHQRLQVLSPSLQGDLLVSRTLLISGWQKITIVIIHFVKLYAISHCTYCWSAFGCCSI